MVKRNQVLALIIVLAFALVPVLSHAESTTTNDNTTIEKTNPPGPTDDKAGNSMDKPAKGKTKGHHEKMHKDAAHGKGHHTAKAHKKGDKHMKHDKDMKKSEGMEEKPR